MSKLNLGRDLYIKGRIGWRGLSKDEYVQVSDYKIINATALMDGYVNWENCGFISKERYEESDEIMLRENDILISKDGTLGKIGYVKNLTSLCTVASGIFVLRNTIPDKLNFDYLYHVLKSNIFKDFIRRNKANGSTINHLYQRDLENFEIELPSLEIQNSIAETLNAIDDKILNNNKINVELESIAKNIYNYWFLQFDFPSEDGKPYKSSGGKMIWKEEIKREIPDGWNVKKVQDILGRIPSTKKYKSDEYDLGTKYPIVDQSVEYVCGYTDDEKELLNLQDCIVFGDHTKYVKYINFPFARGADGTQIIDSSEVGLPNYLLYRQILDLNLLDQGYSRYFKFLKDKFIVVPHKNIADEYMKYMSELLNKAKQIFDENRELISLRDFLLPLLINGQVGFKEGC